MKKYLVITLGLWLSTECYGMEEEVLPLQGPITIVTNGGITLDHNKLIVGGDNTTVGNINFPGNVTITGQTITVENEPVI